MLMVGGVWCTVHRHKSASTCRQYPVLRLYPAPAPVLVVSWTTLAYALYDVHHCIVCAMCTWQRGTEVLCLQAGMAQGLGEPTSWCVDAYILVCGCGLLAGWIRCEHRCWHRNSCFDLFWVCVGYVLGMCWVCVVSETVKGMCCLRDCKDYVRMLSFLGMFECVVSETVKIMCACYLGRRVRVPFPKKVLIGHDMILLAPLCARFLTKWTGKRVPMILGNLLFFAMVHTACALHPHSAYAVYIFVFACGGMSASKIDLFRGRTTFVCALFY